MRDGLFLPAMKKKSHSRAPDKIGFSIALPEKLATELQEIATRETRSRNGQIEHFLRESVQEWKKAQTPIHLKVADELGKESSLSTPAAFAPTKYPDGKRRTPRKKA